ncbi:MAG: DUF2974 domain-containing protein [Lachnospiraceae bacterium]|nr:DUF2974 domain-containing protein [Lachnospiraceae bacterium]
MNGTIRTYLKEYGGVSLKEMPLNDVDSLVLCQLAYLKFDGLVPDVNENRMPVGIREIARLPGAERLFSDERYKKVNLELFRSLCGSLRFGSMELNYYVNLIEKEWEAQFSAVTYFLDDGTVFVAFRGTDETIVGWKEDFNMAFLSPVPSQVCSEKYLNTVTERFTSPFFLGGHSKGGNLAIYSAMRSNEEVQKRIVKIYSMDGPGFRAGILQKNGYEKIADRVVKILPRSSVVGMLFEQEVPYRVVESTKLGIFQHNPYSWIVRENYLEEADEIYRGRKLLDRAVNEWILSLDKEQLQRFVDTLFQILAASEADNLIDFGNDKKKSFLGMADAIRNLDSETSRMMKEVLKELFDIAGTNALREINAKWPKQIIGNKKGRKRAKNERRKRETE